MRRFGRLAALLFALAGLLSGAPSSQGGSDDVRMKYLWSQIRDRLQQQNDIWFDVGDFPRCIQTLRLMVVVYPGDYQNATNLGWLLESIEEDDEALSVYIRYRNQNPEDPDGAWPEANFYFQKKAFAKIPSLLESAIKRRPAPHPNTFRTLAHAYERLGLLKDSKRVWEALLALTPNDGAAKRNLERVNSKISGGGSPPPARTRG